MSLSELWGLVVGAKDQISLGVIILIVLMSIVQVSKININPWDWLLGTIGKKLNSNIDKKVMEIEKKLDKHIKDDETEKLETKRRDILEFANACMNGRRHTQEQFKFVIKKCDEYEKYIEDNHIKNGEISFAIEEIRRLYGLCLQKNSFLKEGKEVDPDYANTVRG